MILASLVIEHIYVICDGHIFINTILMEVMGSIQGHNGSPHAEGGMHAHLRYHRTTTGGEKLH